MRLLCTAAIAASAITTASGQSVTTVFGPGGTIGAATPDAEVLGEVARFSQFGGTNGAMDLFGGTANTGEVLFFAFGPAYVGGAGPASSNPLSAQGLENLGGPVANNRAYGACQCPLRCGSTHQNMTGHSSSSIPVNKLRLPNVSHWNTASGRKPLSSSARPTSKNRSGDARRFNVSSPSRRKAASSTIGLSIKQMF